MTAAGDALRCGLVQMAPVLLDRAATTTKIVDAIRAACADGCRLVAFGETLLPGYPVWLSRTDGARFDAADQKAIHARYLDQAVSIPRGDLEEVCAAARDGATAVVLGIAERMDDRGGHSIACSCVVIDATGRIASVHRKLMPTYEERLAWAPGDGAGLVTHELGAFRLGALNCWENWMPLARTALYEQGEDVRVAIWPGCVRNTVDITRFLALESRSYVLSVAGLLRGRDVPATVPSAARIAPDPDELILDGGTAAAAPDGSWLLEPVEGREGTFIVELDHARVREERQNFDPAGHYARPDVLKLSVDRTRR